MYAPRKDSCVLSSQRQPKFQYPGKTNFQDDFPKSFHHLDRHLFEFGMSSCPLLANKINVCKVVCRFWRRAEDDFPKSGCLEVIRCHHPSIQVLASSLKDEEGESSLEDSKILIVMSLENFDGFSLPNLGIHRS